MNLKLQILAAIIIGLQAPGSIARAAGSTPDAAIPPLSGDWELVPERSTDLSPWRTLVVHIAIDGDRVTIRNQFASGNRAIDTVAAFDLSNPSNVVRIPWWSDNRHIGAYIGGDRNERIRGRLIDGGRILRTEADLVLDTQQGERPVNILTDYKISPSGSELAITQLRSTREIPIVYILHRVSPRGKPVDPSTAQP